MFNYGNLGSKLHGNRGSLYLTAAAALLPIVFFFAALTVLKLKGYQAGLYTLLIALAVAVFGFGMPTGMAVSSLSPQPD
nr:L-lactate permease [Neisseria gonorrhoeae]